MPRVRYLQYVSRHLTFSLCLALCGSVWSACVLCGRARSLSYVGSLIALSGSGCALRPPPPPRSLHPLERSIALASAGQPTSAVQRGAQTYWLPVQWPTPVVAERAQSVPEDVVRWTQGGLRGGSGMAQGWLRDGPRADPGLAEWTVTCSVGPITDICLCAVSGCRPVRGWGVVESGGQIS